MSFATVRQLALTKFIFAVALAGAAWACPPRGGYYTPVYHAPSYTRVVSHCATVTHQDLSGFPKVVIGQQIQLSGAYGEAPGRLILLVNGQPHPCNVGSWQANGIVATIPDCRIGGASLGQLQVLGAAGHMIHQFDLNVTPANPVANVSFQVNPVSNNNGTPIPAPAAPSPGVPLPPAAAPAPGPQASNPGIPAGAPQASSPNEPAPVPSGTPVSAPDIGPANTPVSDLGVPSGAPRLAGSPIN